MPDTDIATESSPAAQSLKFQLPFTLMPERLDKILAGLLPEHSRSRLQDWIEGGHVLVNGQPGRIKQLVKPGDKLLVIPQLAPESLAFTPEAISINVIAQSPDFIVVNKPAGLVTHPGAGNWHGTLLNGLLYHFPELHRVARAGIVHRLDKDTSGLLVVARTEQAQTHLVRQLQARTVGREYVAIVHGRLQKAGAVKLAIGRDQRVPVRMATENPIAPKPAITHYQPLRSGLLHGQPVTQVTCRLETGRTHQIRVHLASIGHALVGDTLYGGKMPEGVSRQLLHALALAFDDVVDHNQRLSFNASLADDIAAILTTITWDT